MSETKTKSKTKTKPKTQTKTKSKTQTKTKSKTQTKTKTQTKSLKTREKSLKTRISSNSGIGSNKHNSNKNISSSFSADKLDNQAISIRFTNGKFLSKEKTVYHIKREPLIKDKVLDFLDDYGNLLLKNKVLSGSILDKELFNHSELNCVCENIFNEHIKNDCKCNNIKKYSSQGKSGASIHSIYLLNKCILYSLIIL